MSEVAESHQCRSRRLGGQKQANEGRRGDGDNRSMKPPREQQGLTGKGMSPRAWGVVEGSEDGTTLSLCPSFIKLTPLAPSPGSVMGNCIPEALSAPCEPHGSGRQDGMDPRPLSLQPKPGRLQEEGCQCQPGVAQHGMARHRTHRQPGRRRQA